MASPSGQQKGLTFLGKDFRRLELSPVVQQAQMQLDTVRETAQLVKLQIRVRGYDVK